MVGSCIRTKINLDYNSNPESLFWTLGYGLLLEYLQDTGEYISEAHVTEVRNISTVPARIKLWNPFIPGTFTFPIACGTRVGFNHLLDF